MTGAEALRHDGPITAIPYALMLGLTLGGEGAVVTLPYADALIGAPGRLHGGVVAGLLEVAAYAALVRTLPAAEPLPALKPVGVTVDFLREGAMRETFATARVIKLGRRLAVLGAEAWQSDRAKPIAAARLNVLLDRGSP